MERSKLELVEYPAKSPDINVIENVWGIMQRQWNSGTLKTEDDLMNYVFDTWRQINIKYPYLGRNLVHSVPKRLQEVYVRSGYWTRY